MKKQRKDLWLWNRNNIRIRFVAILVMGRINVSSSSSSSSSSFHMNRRRILMAFTTNHMMRSRHFLRPFSPPLHDDDDHHHYTTHRDRYPSKYGMNTDMTDHNNNNDDNHEAYCNNNSFVSTTTTHTPFERISQEYHIITNHTTTNNNPRDVKSILYRRRLRQRKYAQQRSITTSTTTTTNKNWFHSFWEDTVPTPSKQQQQKQPSPLVPNTLTINPSTYTTNKSRTPSSSASRMKQQQQQQQQRPHRTSNTGKKIYSLYTRENTKPITTTTTNYSWINYNTTINQPQEQSKAKVNDWEQGFHGITNHCITREDTSLSSSSTTTNIYIPKKRRYWKNHLEEQLDYALGIHEQGHSYQRWKKDIEQQQGDVKEKNNNKKSSSSSSSLIMNGLDMFWNTNTFQGKKQKVEDSSVSSSFWEDDGNILAVLLGKSKNTGWSSTWNSIAKRKNLNWKQFTMTSILYLSFKFFFVFLSSLCRWASCRGSLPQPIVVFSLFASLLSAPRKKRWMIVGLTLIVLRTCAEMIHGYSHEDWDEYDDEELIRNDENKDKSNV